MHDRPRMALRVWLVWASLQYFRNPAMAPSAWHCCQNLPKAALSVSGIQV